MPYWSDGSDVHLAECQGFCQIKIVRLNSVVDLHNHAFHNIWQPSLPYRPARTPSPPPSFLPWPPSLTQPPIRVANYLGKLQKRDLPKNLTLSLKFALNYLPMAFSHEYHRTCSQNSCLFLTNDHILKVNSKIKK